MPTNKKSIIGSFFNQKLQDLLDNTRLYNYPNFTVEWCKTRTNCTVLIKSAQQILKKIDIIHNFQNFLPLLGDYIFGIFNQRIAMQEFFKLTTHFVSEFYDNKVSNISMVDLPAYGAIGYADYKLGFYLDSIEESKDASNDFFALIYNVILNTSFDHPCKNSSFSKFCNIQTDNIIGNNLEKFFKVMFISSTLNINNDFSGIIKNFINMKAFREKFRLLNDSTYQEKMKKYPISFSGFKQRTNDDGDAKEITLYPQITPVGICSSFNSLAHNKIYVESEYSDSWMSVVSQENTSGIEIYN